MSTLTEKLISILERDRNGPEAPHVSPPEPLGLSVPRYEIGTVFYRKNGPRDECAAILVRSRVDESMLVSLPSGNRWSDEHVFKINAYDMGPTIDEFHLAFGDYWQVSRRGKEALAEWAKDDV